MADSSATAGKLRLDKWLWAARFFKTRSLAKRAIEGGKVHVDGARSKVSKELTAGTSLRIRRGLEELTVEVIALSDKRGPAAAAQQLYRETEDSVAAREESAALRRAAHTGSSPPPGRPGKRDRRLIHRFKNRHGED